MSLLRVDDGNKFIDRLEGCLRLGALGDAFGYRIEFDTVEAIWVRYGPGGIRLSEILDGNAWPVSDDTQMTLFTAEGILDGAAAGEEDPIPFVSAAYLRWFGTQEGFDGDTPGGLASAHIMNARRAPGYTCISACRAGACGTPDQPLNDSTGCGGVMRVAPLAFIPGISADMAFDFGARAAALTHGHPSAWLSSGAMTRILWSVSHGVPVRDAVFDTCEHLKGFTDNAPTRDLILKAVSIADENLLSGPYGIAAIGEGWDGNEALAIAIYAVLVSDSDPVRCLETAANHSGDSDSTASIAGQLLGAAKGWKAVKSGVIEDCFGRLDAAELVDRMITGLAGVLS